MRSSPALLSLLLLLLLLLLLSSAPLSRAQAAWLMPGGNALNQNTLTEPQREPVGHVFQQKFAVRVLRTIPLAPSPSTAFSSVPALVDNESFLYAVYMEAEGHYTIKATALATTDVGVDNSTRLREDWSFVSDGVISQMLVTTHNGLADLLWFQDQQLLKIVDTVTGELVKQFPMARECELPNGKYGPIFIPGFHERIPVVAIPCVTNKGALVEEYHFSERMFTPLAAPSLLPGDAARAPEDHSVSSPVMDLWLTAFLNATDPSYREQEGASAYVVNVDGHLFYRNAGNRTLSPVAAQWESIGPRFPDWERPRENTATAYHGMADSINHFDAMVMNTQWGSVSFQTRFANYDRVIYDNNFDFANYTADPVTRSVLATPPTPQGPMAICSRVKENQSSLAESVVLYGDWASDALWTFTGNNTSDPDSLPRTHVVFLEAIVVDEVVYAMGWTPTNASVALYAVNRDQEIATEFPYADLIFQHVFAEVDATYEPSVSLAFGLPGLVVRINHLLYLLDNDVCQGRGEATYLFSGPPVCECTTAKYYGATCGEYCDPQETCNGRGECDEEGRCDCDSGIWADNGADCNTFSEVVLIGAGITLCLLVVIVVVVVILLKRRSRKETSYALLVDDELMDY